MRQPFVGYPNEAAGETRGQFPSVRIVCFGAIFNIILYALQYELMSEWYTYWAPLVMIVVTLLTCAFNGFVILRTFPSYFWSPLPWFLVACTLHFGVGAILYYLGSDQSVAYVNHFFPVDTEILFKTCALNSVGILSVCLSWYATLSLWPDRFLVRPRPMTERGLMQLGFISLAVGVPARYLLVLPNEFGTLGFVLPGSIQVCSQFTSFAVFILVHWISLGRAGTPMKAFTALFLTVEVVSQILTFNKMGFFLLLLMIFFGLYAARPSTKLFASFTVFVLLTYVIITPFMYWCRAMAFEEGRKSGLSERLELVRDYWTVGVFETRQAHEESGVQESWVRLCCVSIEAFCIDAYDRGAPGNSLSLIPYTLIPRFLWPDKPLISIGREFNYFVTGVDNNSVAPGVLGELYWNGGWTFLVLGTVYLGIVLAVFTNITVPSMSARDFRVIPLVLAGMTMGLRVEDFFVLTCVASIPITAAYYIVCTRLA